MRRQPRRKLWARKLASILEDTEPQRVLAKCPRRRARELGLHPVAGLVSQKSRYEAAFFQGALEQLQAAEHIARLPAADQAPWRVEQKRAFLIGVPMTLDQQDERRVSGWRHSDRFRVCARSPCNRR